MVCIKTTAKAILIIECRQTCRQADRRDNNNNNNKNRNWFNSPLSGTTWVSQYHKNIQPVTPILIITHNHFTAFWTWSGTTTDLSMLPPSIMLQSILLVQTACLTVFSHKLFQSTVLSDSVWSPPHNIPNISSPNDFLIFATHAHTFPICFASAPRLCYIILVSLHCLLGIFENLRWKKTLYTLKVL